MYLRFFGLEDHPFSITPNPAFLYLGAQHRAALAHLLYGAGEHGGFVQLTGEVGTGKTTLVRALLEQELPDLDVALCLNPGLTVTEFVAEVCDELQVARPGNAPQTLKTLIDTLNRHLLERHATGRRTVLIVDEAQHLNRDVLEQLRLLTNLETHTHKLMRVILVGQPELEAMLRRPDLRQLAQRITARYHLRALNRLETVAYIRHRLQVAGGAPDLFDDGACRAAYLAAGGVPRLINTVCERALMGGYSTGRQQITAAIVRRAARESLPAAVDGRSRALWAEPLVPAAVLVAATALAFALHFGARRWAPAAPGSPAPAATAPTPMPDTGDTETATGNRADSDRAKPESVAVSASATAPSQQPPEPTTAPDAAPVHAAAPTLPKGDADLDQLLRLWGVFGKPVTAACPALAVGDLRCSILHGDFTALQRLNRPALLTVTAAGQQRRVLLSGLDAHTATLVSSTGTRQVPRAQLAAVWTGDFELIWRLPTTPDRLQRGSIGSGVMWLRRRLAKAHGIDLDNRAGKPSPVFNAALQRQVQAYQRAHDMQADGVVGRRTFIMLNNVAPAAGTPFLRPPTDHS